MENGGDALVSKNEILWDIMFHHQSKQDARHDFLTDGTGNVRPPQTCLIQVMENINVGITRQLGTAHTQQINSQRGST